MQQELPRRRSPQPDLRLVLFRQSLYDAFGLAALGLVGLMSTVEPRRRELAELVSDHGLRDEYRNVLAAIVNGDGVTNHVGKDGGRSRPCANHTLGIFGVHRSDAIDQSLLNERPFAA